MKPKSKQGSEHGAVYAKGGSTRMVKQQAAGPAKPGTTGKAQNAAQVPSVPPVAPGALAIRCHCRPKPATPRRPERGANDGQLPDATGCIRLRQ